MADEISNATIEIPVPSPECQPMAAEQVCDVSPCFGAQLMNQLALTANIAQNNFVTTTKAQDYDYLEGKRIVSLEEAIGVREVTSQHNPGGPTSGPAKV